MFINVIKNAIEASASAIIVTMQARDGSLTVKIKDDGHGMSEERIERLGEPFFSQKEKGTGLGLTVSHKIVEQHEGTIFYDSTVGEGTTVHLAFPLLKEVP